MGPVPEKDIFRDHRGVMVLNGAGAVTKVMRMDGKDHVLQRFISILVPANEYLNKIPGDDDCLPYAGQITLATIEDDEDVLVDSEDFESCFNLFGLPAAWRGHFVFEKQVDGSAFGLPAGEMVYPGIYSVPWGGTRPLPSSRRQSGTLSLTLQR